MLARVFTEFREHGILYLFFTSVHSVCGTELAKIPQNYTEFRVVKFRIVPRNSAEIKSLPHRIPYSAEFQKVTSVNIVMLTT
jgi:hypothetical protein